MLLKLFFLVLFLKLAASVDHFSFNGFTGANLSLDGAAALTSDGLLTLTDMSKQVKGHAFYPTALHFKRTPLGDVVSFSSSFVFAIVSQYPQLGCCGFAFTVSPSRDLSGALATKFMGLFNLNNDAEPSNHILAIEFDTVANPEDRDINDNHVGVDIYGLTSTAAATAGFVSDDDGLLKNLSLVSGEPMQAWIEYDDKSMQLNVTLAPLKMPKPKVPLLAASINLSSVMLEEMYVGFSASTGVIGSQHCILGWSFNMAGKAQDLDLSSLPKLPNVSISSERKLKGLIIWLLLAILILVLLAAAGAKFIVERRKKASEEGQREDWELDFEAYRFSYKDVCKATKGFNDSCLLGVGGFSRVYRGVPPTWNAEVAVKRLTHESRQGARDFMVEIATVGEIRHRNLVQLLGYCRHKREVILVYDFMPNGSLDKFLFGRGKSNLDWRQRFQIIKGVASGLLYLHEDCEKVIVHGDVKASNVFLDSDMNGRLGDFGLARFINHESALETNHLIGTVGYIAPELAWTGKATASSDVFAFGVFLLEVACGRRPMESTNQAHEQVLVDWAYANWTGGTILETKDPRLGEEYVVEQLELVLKLGLLCSHPIPAARPSMRQVSQFLQFAIPFPDLLPHDFIPSSSAVI